MARDLRSKHQWKPTVDALDERVVPAGIQPHVALVHAAVAPFTGTGHTFAGGSRTVQFSRPGTSSTFPGTGGTYAGSRGAVQYGTAASAATRGSVFTGNGNIYAGTGRFATFRAPSYFGGRNLGISPTQSGTGAVSFGSSTGGRVSPYIPYPQQAPTSNFTASTTPPVTYGGTSSYTPTGTLPTYSATGGFYNGGPTTTVTAPTGTAINF